jgi:hypothetical protein
VGSGIGLQDLVKQSVNIRSVMPFQAGVAANPTGNNGQDTRRWKKALERALIRLGEGNLDNGLAKVADRVVDLASQGEKDCWREVAERIDGKVAQAVEHAGADGNAIRVEHIVRAIIDARNTDASSVQAIAESSALPGSVGGSGVRQVTLLRRVSD